MVALQIRNVPVEVRDALVERATLRRQSLQEYLYELVIEHTRQPLPRDFERLAPLRAGVRPGVDVELVVELIRHGREHRDSDAA
ncbi:MAG TPA: hypothetical protein VES42_27140 [Pilimelia sp.]|nr:hypothetical protein [Pilimelia sp.]